MDSQQSHLALNDLLLRSLIASSFSISHWWFRVNIASVGDGDSAVFHSLVIVSFAANKSCVTTTLKMGENSCIVRCSKASSGLGSMCRSHMSDSIEKVLFQKDRTDLHDHRIWYNVSNSPQFLQHRSVWSG